MTKYLTIDEVVWVWYASYEEDIMIAAERHTRDEFVDSIEENIDEYLGRDEKVSERVMREAKRRIVRFCDEALIGQFKRK